MKQFVFTLAGLLLYVQAHAQSEEGAFNQFCDSTLFQNKCGCCHTVGLQSTTCEILPSQVWCLVRRMAKYQGADIYGCDIQSRLYQYIVFFNTRLRAEDLEEALNCIPEERRILEEQSIEDAKQRYE